MFWRFVPQETSHSGEKAVQFLSFQPIMKTTRDDRATLVEATGWQRHDNGTVELTARGRVGDRWMRSNCPVIP